MTRAQVRNLEERSAVWVAKHLVMAGRLIDLDPELAFQHALAASRRGGRLAAVREAVGLTAYAAGHYGEALREFRTFRRISGSNVHLPVMADCERGLGRPDRALDLARSEEAESLDAAGKAELAMVVSGARTDLGQLDAAVAALEIAQLDLHRAFSFSPRLFRAYADALDAVGRSDESGKWRHQAGVAEKALGLDDDLEPDIIDLGEDDDPAPAPVPRVGDVLGRAAPAVDPAGDAATSDDVPTRDGEARDTGDADTTDQADSASDALDGPAGAGAGPDGDADSGADPGARSQADQRDTASIEAAEPGTAGAPAEAAEAGGEHDDEEHEAVPVDAVPAGETSASVQSLQTEMLFSMDESGTADLGSSGAGGDRPSAGPAVEFSEAASSSAGIDAGIDAGPDGQAAETAVGAAGEETAVGEKTAVEEESAPGEETVTRRRSGKAGASQDDVVDD